MNLLSSNLSTTKIKNIQENEKEQGSQDEFDEKKVIESINKLKKVHQESVERGLKLKELSQQIMREQLLEKQKKGLIYQVMQNKRKLINEQQAYHIISSPPKMGQRSYAQLPISQSLTNIGNYELGITPKQAQMRGKNKHIMFNKIANILVQSESQLPYFSN